MTYIHHTLVRDAMCQVAIDAVNTGTGFSSGRLELQNLNNTPLVVFILPNPAFNNVSNGQALLKPVSSLSAIAKGLVSKAVFKNRDNVVTMTGTVTVAGAGGDFEATGMDLNVSIGDLIILNSLVYNAPQ